MSELRKKAKESMTIGKCPQDKGLVTSRNSEKFQRCVKEGFPKGEIMERRPLSPETREYFDLMLMEDELKKARAKVATKNFRIG